MPNPISIAEAAQQLGVTTKTVRNFIARGQLTGFRVGSRMIRVDHDEVLRLLRPIPNASKRAS